MDSDHRTLRVDARLEIMIWIFARKEKKTDQDDTTYVSLRLAIADMQVDGFLKIMAALRSYTGRYIRCYILSRHEKSLHSYWEPWNSRYRSATGGARLVKLQLHRSARRSENIASPRASTQRPAK